MPRRLPLVSRLYRGPLCIVLAVVKCYCGREVLSVYGCGRRECVLARRREVARASADRLRQWRSKRHLCLRCGQARPRATYLWCTGCRTVEKARQARLRAKRTALKLEKAAALRVDRALLLAAEKRSAENARLQKQRIDDGLPASSARDLTKQKPHIRQE